MIEKIPLHSPSGVGLVLATIVAALIVLGFCAALDKHYRRLRHRDLRWYADRITELQRERDSVNGRDGAALRRGAHSRGSGGAEL